MNKNVKYSIIGSSLLVGLIAVAVLGTFTMIPTSSAMTMQKGNQTMMMSKNMTSGSSSNMTSGNMTSAGGSMMAKNMTK